MLRISLQETSGLLVGLDDDKRLTFEKFWEKFPLEKWSQSRLRGFGKRNLIISADPSSAVTASYPIEMKRALYDCAEQLNETELENLLAQEIGRSFGSERAEAARRLGLHELDAVLVNAEAGDFKIDGRHVVNPLSFTGESIGAVMRMTFASRPVFDYLKHLFGSGGFFFTSDVRSGLFLLSKLEQIAAASGSAHASLASQGRLVPAVNLAIASASGVACFSLQKSAWGSAVYEEKFNWQPNALIAAIASAFRVGEPVAAGIYENYLSGDVSPRFGRFIGSILKSEIGNFLNGLKSSRLRGTTFIHSSLALPLASPIRCGYLTLSRLPARAAFVNLGFRLEFKDWPMSPEEIFMRLAPFFEFYYDHRDSNINSRLRRRIHWLAQK